MSSKPKRVSPASAGPAPAGMGGLEAGVSRHDHQAIRLWLRLLACSTQIEQDIRTRLRGRFGTTLARFDYLAQLDRHPQGLRMNTLSRHLMVTGGNVTGLTDQLVAEGWVERINDARDRRVMWVRSTALGRRQFQRMAAEHEKWLEQMLAPMRGQDVERLYRLLGQLRAALAQAAAGKEQEAGAAG